MLFRSKTTYLKWIAYNWVIRNHRILFISNENTASSIIASIDAMVAGWNPIKIRHGGWTEKDKRKVKSAAYFASISDGEIIVPKGGRTDVQSVIALHDEFSPDAILIDGVYLMTSGRGFAKGWEKEKAVSQDLKALAMNRGCPIVGTIQQGRATEGKRATKEGAAGTDGYLQDADIFLATSVIDDQRILEILKNRWGGEGTALGISIDFDRMTVNVTRAIFEEDEEESS